MAEGAEASESGVLQAKILRQVEYYFSDDSFPFDDYLRGKCDGEPVCVVCTVM